MCLRNRLYETELDADSCHVSRKSARAFLDVKVHLPTCCEARRMSVRLMCTATFGLKWLTTCILAHSAVKI